MGRRYAVSAMLLLLSFFLITTSVWGQLTTSKNQDAADPDAKSANATENASPTDSPTDDPKEIITLEDGIVFIKGDDGQKTEMPLPAKVASMLIHENELYLAMGNIGAAVYDISHPNEPILLRQVSSPRESIIGFALVDEEVWMRMMSMTLVPASEVTPSMIPADATLSTAIPTSKAAKAVTAEKITEPPLDIKRPIHITGLRPGEITLDIGTRDNVEVGDRFSVYHTIKISDKTGQKQIFEGSELVAVIEVTAVNEENSLAELWRGDRVFATDIVKVVDEKHDTSLMYPRRLDHLGEMSIIFRPILDIDHGGLGAMFTLRGTYIGRFWFAGINVMPLGMGITERGKLINVIASGEAGYDGRPFGLGIGVGVAAGYASTKEGWNEDAPPDSLENEAWKSHQSGFVLSQVIRLGTRDGLQFTGRNSMVDFEWGGFHGQLNIPLTCHTTLYVEGGGAAIGYGMGAVGVSTWLRGNGDVDSFGLSVSAGFVALWVERSNAEDGGFEDDMTTLGPMVSLGIDYRFGRDAQ